MHWQGSRGTVLWPLSVALLVGALAWLSPLSNAGSDAALQLVAAQALVQRRTLDLGVYEGDPRLRFDLEHDYRVWRSGGHARYYLLLPPILDAPFVWLANRAGLDMRRAEHEAWLQNALSALVCGLALLVLQALCQRLVGARAALTLASVAMLGSPLISTLGAALWPAGHALLLVLGGLLLVVGPPLRATAWRVAGVLACLVAAYLCRPASAFCALGLVTAGLVALPRAPRRRVLVALAGLAVVAFGAAALLGWRRLGTLVPIYYSPLKAWPNTPLGLGLYGTLLSPGRGLFVFCPFLVPIALGAVLCARALLRDPLAWLAAVWLGAQILLTSVKPYWWGGNSFGPRLLLETIPAWVLLAALVWSQDLRPALRRGLASAFLVLGAVSIAIHSGQGLWNPAVQAWNRGPAATLDLALLFDWRWPQALATADSVSARDTAWQEARLLDLRPGDVAGADSRHLVYMGFHPLENTWRPSALHSALRFRARGFAAHERYLLELRASAPSDRHVALTLGDWQADVAVTPPVAYAQRIPISGAQLADGDHELRIDVPGAARLAPEDPRVVGVNLCGLSFLPWPAPSPGVDVSSDARFLVGFDDASAGGRWTVASEARLLLQFPRTNTGYRLELDGIGNGDQSLQVLLDGRGLGTCAVAAARTTCTLDIEGSWLRDDGLCELTLRLPGAHALPSDPRRLGIFLMGLRLVPTR